MWPEQAKNLRSTARLHHALLIEVFKTQVRACVSIFLEADYYSFNGTNVSFAGDLINPTPAFAVKTTQNVETLKFVLNYRFGGASGPQASPY